MKLATTIILAVAAVGLGVYAYLDHTGALSDIFGEKLAPTFEGPAVPLVNSLTIKDATETRRLEKREGRWHITSPIEDLADPAWIESVMETFKTMHPKEFLRDDSGTEREGYGLTQERGVPLEIGFPSGEPLVYHIGNAGPFEKSTYLYPGSAEAYEGAFVVMGDFRSLVEQPVTDMVDPTLAQFDQSKLTGLSFKQGPQTIELQRTPKPGSPWRVAAPVQYQADEVATTALISKLATIAISGVHPRSADEGAPEAAPTHVITVEASAPQPPFELSFRPHPTDETLVRARHSLRPLDYDVPKTVLDDFPNDPAKLRETKLLRVAAADLTRVKIARRGQTDPLTLEHAGVWLLGSEVIDEEKGEQFLKLFNETEIDLHLEGGPDKAALYGLDDPFLTVTFEGESLGPLQEDSCTLRVGLPPESPQAFVSIEGMPTIAAVDQTFPTSLAQVTEPLHWKDLEVLNIAFSHIRAVSLEPKGKATTRLAVDFGHETPDQVLRVFRNEQDRTDDIDRHAAAQLIMNLGTFSAQKWMPATEEAMNALTTPSLKVTIKSAEKKEDELDEVSLRFAPTGSGNSAFYYGQVEGSDEPAPFLVSREEYERLTGSKLLLEVKP